MAYNVDEINRFAGRLEEQASNFQIAADNIDYDFRRICTILLKYQGESAKALANESNNFGDGWLTEITTIKGGILQLSAMMFGFYKATHANEAMTKEKLESLKNQFISHYKDTNTEPTSMAWASAPQTGYGKRPSY